MDPALWQRIQSLFHAALELPPEQRAAFLTRECAGDEPLREQVTAMLAEDARYGSFLDRNMEYVVYDVLDGSVPHLERVGPYEIRGVIGHGGMGVVYLAYRADLGSTAAIKVLRDAALSPARRERFASEQRTLAQLSHPGIAHLYDADTLADGTPYFVMEYVAGTPLTEYCDQQQCSSSERLRLFRDVCAAVQYAHGHAVVHRDVKPSNILVTADGAIKLLDFGIAKQLEDITTDAKRTQTWLHAMTPAYAAPEQIRGEVIGTYTDVYALGVVLYELITGRLPHELSRHTPGEAELAILEHDPAKPSAVVARAADVAPAARAFARLSDAQLADLDVLCMKALQRDPQQRYRTVEALLRDLDHFARGEPLEARPPSWRYTASRFVRRHARAVTATAAALIVMIGVVAFYTVRLARARDAALLEAARTQRIQTFVLDLFEGGDPAAGPADSLRVVTLVDRGVSAARALSAEPAIQQELYQTLGGIYQKLGNLTRADSLLTTTLEQRRAQLGADHPEVGRTLVALGLLRVDQAEFEDAERLVREGIDIARRHYPADHPAVARAVTALGVVLQNSGSYDEAIATLQDALRMQAGRATVDADFSHTIVELANTYFYAGQYPASDSLNQQLLATNRELYGEKHPLVADALINLSAVQFQLGHYQQAEAYLRDALDIYLGYYGPDHYETAAAMNMLGQALVFQGRWEEAIDMLRRALDIRERVYGPVHPRVASSLSELGTAAYRQGDLVAAEKYYQRMADIYQQVYGGKHYLMGIARSNLGSVHMEAGRLTRAESLFREAIALFLENLPPEHVNTAVARIKLGRSLVRQGKHADAENELLAGYNVMVKQASPSVSFLKAAREDLIVVYEKLQRPDQVTRFRDELAKADGG